VTTNPQPVAVPAFEKSSLARPVTFWDIVIEYEIALVVFVGFDCVDVNVDGAGAPW
jgi:hypothetical protein